jgi:protein-S-isoprenylcysteine O-methyltransferase Ste14
MSNVSATEQSTSARIGRVLFRFRGFVPIPFLLIPLFASGRQTRNGWMLGLAFIVVGEISRIVGVAAAGTVTRRRSRDVQRLVTYGIFSWMRNPLYVGNFLVWIGFAIGSGVHWFVPVAILFFAIEYTYIVRYEEGVLESIFGQEYLDYKARTPRWIPRPPARKESGPHDFGEALRSEVSTFAQYIALGLAFFVKFWFLAMTSVTGP